MEKTWCSHSCFSKTNPNCHEDIVNDSELRTGLKLNLYTHLQLKTLPNTAPFIQFPSYGFFFKYKHIVYRSVNYIQAMRRYIFSFLQKKGLRPYIFFTLMQFYTFMLLYIKEIECECYLL